MLSLEKRSRHFLARNWIGGVRTIFQFLYSHANVFCFCLNYIFVFSLSVRQMVHCDMFENRFWIFLHSKYGKWWWMCAKMLSYCHLLGNVCALHIEPTLSLSFFLSYFSLLHLHCFQTTKTFFCTLVVSYFFLVFLFCLDHHPRLSSFLLPSLLMISALIHLSFPLTIFLPTPPSLTVKWRSPTTQLSCSFSICSYVYSKLHSETTSPPPRTVFLSPSWRILIFFCCKKRNW